MQEKVQSNAKNAKKKEPKKRKNTQGAADVITSDEYIHKLECAEIAKKIEQEKKEKRERKKKIKILEDLFIEGKPNVPVKPAIKRGRKPLSKVNSNKNAAIDNNNVKISQVEDNLISKSLNVNQLVPIETQVINIESDITMKENNMYQNQT